MKNLLIGFGILFGIISLFNCGGDKTNTTGTKESTSMNVDTSRVQDFQINHLPLDEFSKKWQADTAKNSFRSDALDYDTATRDIISVNGIKFLNLSEAQVRHILGKPDTLTSSRDSLTLDYFLAPYCAFAEEEGCPRWVLEIVLKQGIVTRYYSSFIAT